MFRIVKAGLLCVAAILLLLHNILPHEHHGAINAVEHEREHESWRIADILRTIFHNDFGEIHHLEVIDITNTNNEVAVVLTAEVEPDTNSDAPLLSYHTPIALAAVKRLFISFDTTLEEFIPPLLANYSYKNTIVAHFIAAYGLRGPPRDA